MKRCLVTYADDAQQALLDVTRPTMADYADRHDYELWVAGPADVSENGRKPTWSKIPLLRAALQSFDVALWPDADVIVRKPSLDIAEDTWPEDFQAFVMEVTRASVGPQAGVWWIRSCPRAFAFLDAVWQAGPLPDAMFDEQAVVADLLGFSYLPTVTKPLRGSQWLVDTGWLAAQWNARPVVDLAAETTGRFVHFGGMTLGEKIDRARRVVRAERLPGLVDFAPQHAVPAAERWTHPLRAD